MRHGFVVAALLLGACDGSGLHAAVEAGSGGASPMVRARGGGAASVTIIACLGSVGVLELVQGLATHGELAIAERDSTARLTLNLCGVAPNLSPELLAEVARRRRAAP